MRGFPSLGASFWRTVEVRQAPSALLTVLQPNMMAEGRGATGRNKRQDRGHDKDANRRGNRHNQAALIRRAMNLPEAWEGFTNMHEGKLRETDPTKHRIKFLKEFLQTAQAKRETREREFDRQMSSRAPLKASAKKGPRSRPTWQADDTSAGLDSRKRKGPNTGKDNADRDGEDLQRGERPLRKRPRADAEESRSPSRRTNRREAPASSGSVVDNPERFRRSPSVTPSRQSSSPTGDRLKPEDILDELETLCKEVEFFRDAIEHQTATWKKRMYKIADQVRSLRA